MVKKNHLLSTGYLLLAFLALQLSACSPTPTEMGMTITIGTPLSPLTELLWLADEQGFFEAEGVRVKLIPYPSGKRALQAFLEGKLTLAATAETPFVMASFSLRDLRLFASIGSSDNEVRLIARADRGIHQPADLKGRVVATQKGSAVHFFLSSLLLFHHLTEDEIKLRFLKAEALPLALAAGDIDAFSMREPFLQQARDLLQGAIVEFEAPGIYTKHYLLVGIEGSEGTDPQKLAALLHALLRAQRMVEQEPKQVIERFARRLKMETGSAEALWSGLNLELSLRQALFTTLEEEASWAKDRKLVTGGKSPNMLTYLAPGPLISVNPRSVTLFGYDLPASQ